MPTQDCPKLSTDANLPPKAHAQSQRRRAGIRQFDNSRQPKKGIRSSIKQKEIKKKY
jgi:hypothetical protein